jgi:hypothetical protein
MSDNKEMCNIPDKILEQLQKDVAEIKTALIGNEYNPTGGLLHRTQVLERRVEDLEKRIDKAFYILVGASAVVSALVNIFAIILF